MKILKLPIKETSIKIYLKEKENIFILLTALEILPIKLFKKKKTASNHF